MNINSKQVMSLLDSYCGGYKFNNGLKTVFKPESVINCFKSNNFSWKLNKNKGYDDKIMNIMKTANSTFAYFGNFLETIDFENPSLKQML